MIKSHKIEMRYSKEKARERMNRILTNRLEAARLAYNNEFEFLCK